MVQIPYPISFAASLESRTGGESQSTSEPIVHAPEEVAMAGQKHLKATGLVRQRRPLALSHRRLDLICIPSAYRLHDSSKLHESFE
jgi:hypothetical protein